jgi:UDP-perosamine 4-acetyltransferase
MKSKIILIGTGGHAKVVADIIRTEGKYEIVGCTTNDTHLKVFGEYKVIGTDEHLSAILQQGINKVFVALGDNKIRKKVTDKIHSIGFETITIIHPSAQVGKNVKIGTGTCLMAGSIINPDTEIGDGVIINTNTSVDHDCKIDNWVHIAPGSNLAGTICVGEGTMLGVGTIVIPGIIIGSWSMLGAGSVVVKDIPEKTKAYGVPARCIEVIN